MVRKFLPLILSLILAAFAACSEDKPAEAPRAPAQQKSEQTETKKTETKPSPASTQYGLSIVPERATRSMMLEVRPRGFSLDDAELVWMLNDTPVGTPRVEFFDSPDMDLLRGDRIQAVARIGNDEVLSNVVEIENAPPVIRSYRFVPEVFQPGQNLGVEVEAEDSDGDPVTLEYEWMVNDFPAGTGPELGRTIQRGDKFSVTITPFDGIEQGKPFTLTRDVGNLPPRINRHEDYSFDGTTYSYNVDASDPDGDALSYFLKSGPEGMTIDQASGVVAWQVPGDFVGEAKYEVAASDGKGGEARMQMSFFIEVETPQQAQ
jgi:hypothetical protein